MSYNDIDILLVDNSIDDAAVTIHTLKKNGLFNTILHVRNGEEALDYIFCKNRYLTRNIMLKPKLILLDMKTPKAGSIELINRLKADPDNMFIPIIFLMPSAYNIETKPPNPSDGYLTKPIDNNKLLKVLKDLGLLIEESNQPSISVS
ncbi:MAG: hypothetical protein NTX03_04380 [Bacteroidetes bacterium]|nr:hypothetical protein [Bacteroidota bacterium]